MIRICLAKTAVEGLRARTNAALTPEQISREAMALMHRRTAQTGGLIVVSHDGSLGLARTTRTMTWACVRSDGTTGAASRPRPDPERRVPRARAV